MKKSVAAQYITPVLKWSLGIHAVYLIACILLITTQETWMKQLYSDFKGYEFVFPAASFSWAFIRFGLHLLLAFFILRRRETAKKGSHAAVLSFIYLGIGFLSGFEGTDNVILFCMKASSMISAAYRDCMSGFYVAWGWLSPLLRMSMLLFLIGCAMSWYCKNNIVRDAARQK